LITKGAVGDKGRVDDEDLVNRKGDFLDAMLAR